MQILKALKWSTTENIILYNYIFNTTENINKKQKNGIRHEETKLQNSLS